MLLDEFNDFENVFKSYGLLLSNDLPSGVNVMIDDESPISDLRKVIDHWFKPDTPYIQLICANRQDDENSRELCPYFRFFMKPTNMSIDINHKLRNFMAHARIVFPQTMHRSACVLVIGQTDSLDTSKVASVPYCFQQMFMSRNDDLLTFRTSSTGLNVTCVKFLLLTPCDGCSTATRRCKKVLPCSAAGEADLIMFGPKERLRRIRVLNKNLHGGIYIHNDVVRYQLALQSVRVNCAVPIFTVDMQSMYRRLLANFPATTEVPSFMSGGCNFQSLPVRMKMLITGNQGMFKIEWMCQGGYKVFASKKYEEEIMEGNKIIEEATQLKMPFKLIDFVNSNPYDFHFKLWIESVFLQNTVVEMKAETFMKKSQKAEIVNIKMLTVLYGFDKMITLTMIHPTTMITL